MAFGLGALRLSPAHFWSMTIPEIAAAARALPGGAAATPPPTRSELASLLQRFPDTPREIHA